MSNTPPEEPDYEEVEEGSPFGGGECDESSPEPQQTEDAGEENLYPFDGCLSVEYFEDPGEASEQPLDNAAIYDGQNVESTEQSFNESTDTYVEYEPDVQVNEESYDPEDLQKTYNYDDFMYSNASSFDEGSNSNFEENREEPKGSALGRFNKIAKAVEIAEYETLQVVYQLLYQRSAWDTQQILARRILEFSGFNFGEKSEDYFNREMMLRTQPNDMLVKIGAVLGLSQIQKMLFDMDNGRADLIASIMYFLSKPNKTTHLGIKYGAAVATDPVIPENPNVPPPRTISTCGCRHRCFRKFSQARQKVLLEYMKTLDERKLGDKYLLTLIDCKKIVRQPNENLKKVKEVSYEYKCKFGSKQTVVCKGAFVTLHGVKQGRMNNLQLKLKKGRVPKINPEDFPPMVPLEEEEKEESEPESENSKNTSISTEQQNQDSQNESPKVATPSKQNMPSSSMNGKRTRRRKQWDETLMKEAIKAVRYNQMGLNKAGTLYGVPKTSLRRLVMLAGVPEDKHCEGRSGIASCSDWIS